MTTLAFRFEAKYVPVTETGCWLWTSNLNGGGYGLLSFGTPPSRKWRLAHRVAYELHRGQIPEGLDVLHKCDVPSCVNPDHLFVGTDKDNIQDCIRKGRWNRPGRRPGQKKLTDDQIRQIRSGGSTTRFAKEFGVCLSTIKRVKNGKSFKHIC